MAEHDVTILSANYDKTSSFGKGADRGPAAVLGCLNNQIEVFERFTETEPVSSLKINQQDIGDLNGLSPEQMAEKVSEEFTKSQSSSEFTILLGGEHSITNGSLKSLSKDAGDITVLQIDAHMDLRDDDSDYANPPHGKLAHSCVMRRASEMGFPIVQVGVRAYSKEEKQFAESKDGIKTFEWGTQPIPSIEEIIDSVKTEKVYITLDVDGIDPAHMPATGTPVQGGLEWYYTLKLLDTLFQKKKIVAADIVEVAPRPNDTLTEYGAAQILYSMIAYNKK